LDDADLAARGAAISNGNFHVLAYQDDETPNNYNYCYGLNKDRLEDDDSYDAYDKNYNFPQSSQ
jgi:hypothetical protein